MSQREDDLPSLISIGSCNLHVVDGTEKEKMEIKENSESFFTMFHRAHARKDDFISVTGSTTFSLFFCTTRHFVFISWVIFLTFMILCDIGG